MTQREEDRALEIVKLAVGAFVAMIVMFFVVGAFAHDSWISRGGLRNSAGEWCCGEGDCFVLDREDVVVTAGGYAIKSLGETVPFSEAQPSPDGAYWRCKRPDGTRRCFFAPPPNT